MSDLINLRPGRTGLASVKGYAPGRSRTTNAESALPGYAYGQTLPMGRLVVYSPLFNMAEDAGENNPERSFVMPDETGEYIINPLNGLPLSDTENADLLAALDVGKVAGVTVHGSACNTGKCFQPDAWPVGYKDENINRDYAERGGAVTVMTHGYAWVPVITDAKVGDSLSYETTFDDADPEVGTYSFGFFADGSVGIPLPDTWKVVTGAKAGGFAEIYVGA